METKEAVETYRRERDFFGIPVTPVRAEGSGLVAVHPDEDEAVEQGRSSETDTASCQLGRIRLLETEAN